MGYKAKKTLKDNKVSIIVIIILWILFTIILVAPLAYAIGKVNANGGFNFGETLTTTISEIATFSSIIRVFSEGYGAVFGKVLLYFSIIYAVFAFIGLWKSKPKSEYTDIEHGSSDWSEGGEQYAILSKNKGIILAQNNYLPVDKRGNVNVLVVGRFRFW